MEILAIKLEGCSKKDRKKAIKLAKSAGFKWRDKDRFKDNNWTYLIIRDNYAFYYYDWMFFKQPAISLPQDWNKLYEFLGLEMVEKVSTPKQRKAGYYKVKHFGDTYIACYYPVNKSWELLKMFSFVPDSEITVLDKGRIEL
jgi:hypothetical protein